MSAPVSDQVTLLAVSGQTRKLYVAAALSLGGIGFAYLANVPMFDSQFFAQLAVAITGCLIAVVGVFVALRGIRCPSCDLAWVAWAIRTQSAGQWLSAVLDLTACPSCGFSGDRRPKQPNNSLEPTRMDKVQNAKGDRNDRR